MNGFPAVFLPSSAIMVSVSSSAPCTFLACPLSGPTSAVDHLQVESICHNSLKVFSCILALRPVQLAVQLLPRICLLFSPAHSSHFFKQLLQIHLPLYLIYLLPDHIHLHVGILQLELFLQGSPDQYSLSPLTWHIHDLTWKLIIGPNVNNFFVCSANHHTRLHWLHLTQPW